MLEDDFIHRNVVFVGGEVFYNLAGEAGSAQKRFHSRIFHFFYINIIESLAVTEPFSVLCERYAWDKHEEGGGR